MHGLLGFSYPAVLSGVCTLASCQIFGKNMGRHSYSGACVLLCKLPVLEGARALQLRERKLMHLIGLKGTANA